MDLRRALRALDRNRASGKLSPYQKFLSDVGIVVERHLAKVQARFRLPHVAPIFNYTPYAQAERSGLLWTRSNGLFVGDQRHLGRFRGVRRDPYGSLPRKFLSLVSIVAVRRFRKANAGVRFLDEAPSFVDGSYSGNYGRL